MGFLAQMVSLENYTAPPFFINLRASYAPTMSSPYRIGGTKCFLFHFSLYPQTSKKEGCFLEARPPSGGALGPATKCVSEVYRDPGMLRISPLVSTPTRVLGTSP